MNGLLVTVDLDWAPEPAIEATLDFLQGKGITPTVFITHRSARVEASMNELEVGLHPYFDPHSSHGSTIQEVVDHVMDLPHNLPAFRCHRFKVCNQSRHALMQAGLRISSNVCTDLEVLPPHRDRFGLVEVPIFMEDGGYLWHQYPLEMHEHLQQAILKQGSKVLLIHPMHFAVNTPNFDYMVKIKQSMSRREWNTMSIETLNRIKWKGRGIRNLLEDLLEAAPHVLSTGMRSLL